MKNRIDEIIKNFVEDYSKNKDINTRWKEPLVAYADGLDDDFYNLKNLVSPTHNLPTDFLEDAKTVIAYFLPFEDEIIKSNIEGIHSSKQWALAYVETNKLIAGINENLNEKLKDLGYDSVCVPATHNFDEKKLISDWSHRHAAFIAGIGSFGLNNMLITEKGCCGRVGTLITNLKIEPTERKREENCLYKYGINCRKCVDRCVNRALSLDFFDRHRCYEMCLENAGLNEEIGLADVCGKCLVNLPCSTRNPVRSCVK